MNTELKNKIKDVAIRSLKTFWETALGYLVVNGQETINALAAWDVTTVKALLPALAIGAVATGFCAVYNGVIEPLLKACAKRHEHKEGADYGDAL